MTKDTKQLTFPITTELNARTGLHRTLFCRLTVSYNGTTLTQNFGGRGTLRVDPPPTPPAWVDWPGCCETDWDVGKWTSSIATENWQASTAAIATTIPTLPARPGPAPRVTSRDSPTG
jgi:hypothetical protein